LAQPLEALLVALPLLVVQLLKAHKLSVVL
jgi:hypothetical protein